MTRICFFLMVLSGLTILSCSRFGSESEGVILPVKEISNKTARQVEKILGAPDTTYTINILGKAIFCQRYRKNNVEIQYYDQLATDIVIYGPHDLPFDQTALSAFGLDHQAHPSEYMKARYIKWQNEQGFESISFYNPQKDSAGNITTYNIFFKAAPDSPGS